MDTVASEAGTVCALILYLPHRHHHLHAARGRDHRQAGERRAEQMEELRLLMRIARRRLTLGAVLV